jgi:predicted metalloendopeptidase
MASSRKDRRHTRYNKKHRSHGHGHGRKQTVRRRKHNKEHIQRNNFYLWANHKWLKEVPKTLPRELRYIRPLDNFKLIQDEMYKNVLTMYRDYIKGHGGHSGHAVIAKQMKNMYTSFVNLDPEPIQGHIAGFCHMYNNMVQENNIYKFLGVMNQNEMIKWSLPVVWAAFPDEYIPKHISPHIWSPSLSLYDYRFYIDDKILEKQMRGVRVNVNKTAVIRQEEQTGGGGSGGGHGGGGGGGGHNFTKSADDDETKDDGGPETKTVEYIKYKQRITRAFMKLIDDVFTKCLGHDYENTHFIKAQDVYDIECTLMRLMNAIDTRFDTNYANMYNTAKHPDIPPHKVKPTQAKSRDHRHKYCDCGNDDKSMSDAPGTTTTTTTLKDRLKSPHYQHNIRGATRVLERDAVELTDIDWREMAEHIGYPSGNIPRYFITSQVGYLKSVMCILKKEWASDKWKSYWYFIYMRQLICFHDKWREIYLDFNDTLIRGKDTHFPREYFPIIGLGYAFPKTMTDEFTKRYKNEEMISKVREIGNTMLDCYKDRIKKNAWLSAYTKKGALKKLNTIELRIGDANLSAPDPTNLDYDPKDAWGNLVKRSVQRTVYIAKHSGAVGPALSTEDLDLMTWNTLKFGGYQSFIVNAYYTAHTNSIYIPTAYMHSMNVQFGRGYEYDLASVGFTFGHEISHALHVQSRVYDYKGIIKNWWTRPDIATYESKIAGIRRQYEDISKKYGFVIDGNLSLSENLADVTGLAVCEDALHRFHDTTAASAFTASSPASSPASSVVVSSDHMRSMSFQHFYTYYAIQNRQYANRLEILVQVITNPHLDLKIRTNVPLMRSKTFREVFDIHKGDKMYSDDFDVVF